MFGLIIFVLIMVGLYSIYKKLSFLKRIVLKAIAVYIMMMLTVCSFIGLTGLIGDAFEEASDRTVSGRLQSAESALQYSGVEELQERMIYDADFETDFDAYWELCEANELYNQYKIYEKASQKDKKEQCRKELKDIVAASSYAQNAPILKNLLISIQAN